MMQSGDISPALDEPVLPEFRGSLSLANSAAKTTSDGLDVIDLMTPSTEKEVKATSNNAIGSRQRSSTSPGSSETLFSASPSTSGAITMAMAQGFFSSREAMLQRAVEDCKNILFPEEEDGHYLGSWLLTLVDHWDNEKERVILLCTRSLFIVKYDFITLSLLDHHRLPLDKITTLTIGNLEYPPRSITPRVQYLANRVSFFVRNCLQLGQEAGQNGLQNLSSTLRDGTQKFYDRDPSDRQGREGARISWQATSEPNLTQIWNPWSKEIPWLTIVSHPLLICKADQNDPRFDVQDFVTNFRNAIQALAATRELAHSPEHERCLVEYKPIIMETYIGLPALVHNYGELGFYKVRGKISF